MILLERISLAAKGHPTHLSAERVDHRIALALAVEVRVPMNSR